MPDLKVKAVAGRAMGAFSKIRNAMVFAFPPPAVVELGMGTGVDFQLLDRGGLGHDELMEARNQLLGMAAAGPAIGPSVRPNGLEDVPEYRVDVDWEKAGALGVPISAIHNTISAAFGSAYVNDFIQGGRVKRVYVQADAPYRMLPEDLEKLYVRNTAGKMVPFSSFASGRWPSVLPGWSASTAFPSMNIWGEPAPGRSSGEAMQAMEEIVAKLPQGIGFDWTGLSYQERMATSQGPILYAFSILVIFLCVAALYESWTIPFVNLLMLPLGVFGAWLATSLRGLPNDVYFQIGFLTTLGLSTKNAILIIQFIKEQTAAGRRTDRGNPCGRENPFPPRHHDLAGILLRHAAAGHRHRRRRRRHECHRHRRYRRDALRHIHRSDFHPAVLCPYIPPVHEKAAPATPCAISRFHQDAGSELICTPAAATWPPHAGRPAGSDARTADCARCARVAADPKSHGRKLSRPNREAVRRLPRARRVRSANHRSPHLEGGTTTVRILRFIDSTGRTQWGIPTDDRHAAPIVGDLFGSFTVAGSPVEIVCRLAPVTPPNIYGVGRNYREHAAEMTAEPPPTEPLIFLKATTSVIGPDESIILPASAPEEVDYEGELAVVIGRRVKNVPESTALDCVFGYTCANDVTARDCQHRRDKQWARGKSFDTFCSLGPVIVTRDELDPTDALFARRSMAASCSRPARAN